MHKLDENITSLVEVMNVEEQCKCLYMCEFAFNQLVELTSRIGMYIRIDELVFPKRQMYLQKQMHE